MCRARPARRNLYVQVCLYDEAGFHKELATRIGWAHGGALTRRDTILDFPQVTVSSCVFLLITRTAVHPVGGTETTVRSDMRSSGRTGRDPSWGSGQQQQLAGGRTRLQVPAGDPAWN